MAEDWQVGDLALCVVGGPPRRSVARDANGQLNQEHESTSPLRKGAFYTVAKVGDPVRHPTGDGWVYGLKMKEIDGGWISWRFVKVTPLEADAEDAATIRLLTAAPAPALTGSG